MSHLVLVEYGEPTEVFRIGYEPDPWIYTPWQFSTDGRFGGRFCDPSGNWRVLYTGSTALSCYLEVLASFRPDPYVVAGLQEVAICDDDSTYLYLPPGVVPASWCDDRLVGEAQLTGSYANVVSADSLSWLHLHPDIAAAMIDAGVDELDGSVIRNPKDRAVTQQISRILYEWSGPEPLDGIEYESRHGDDYKLWALFERTETGRPYQLLNETHRPVAPDDDDFLEALRVFGLTLDNGL
jgi:hypothetical protein